MIVRPVLTVRWLVTEWVCEPFYDTPYRIYKQLHGTSLLKDQSGAIDGFYKHPMQFLGDRLSRKQLLINRIQTNIFWKKRPRAPSRRTAHATHPD